MLDDRDQRFYTGLMLALLFFAFVFRMLLKVSGYDFYIPYVDDVITAGWALVGEIARAIAGTLGSWSAGRA